MLFIKPKRSQEQPLRVAAILGTRDLSRLLPIRYKMPPPGKLRPRPRPEAVLGAELRAQHPEARALGVPGIPSCCQAQN